MGGRSSFTEGSGAAIAWGSGDLFVTSAHVATGSHATILTATGRTVPGQVILRDAERDLAVVHAPAAGVAPAMVGDPGALRSGSLVFAVGHPFGVRDAVTMGVFQAVGALPRGYALGRKPLHAWVQADVRLAPGNSGGPLADAQGRVIGVAAMIASGLALAVPVQDVERLLASLT